MMTQPRMDTSPGGAVDALEGTTAVTVGLRARFCTVSLFLRSWRL